MGGEKIFVGWVGGRDWRQQQKTNRIKFVSSFRQSFRRFRVLFLQSNFWRLGVAVATEGEGMGWGRVGSSIREQKSGVGGWGEIIRWCYWQPECCSPMRCWRHMGMALMSPNPGIFVVSYEEGGSSRAAINCEICLPSLQCREPDSLG